MLHAMLHGTLMLQANNMIGPAEHAVHACLQACTTPCTVHACVHACVHANPMYERPELSVTEQTRGASRGQAERHERSVMSGAS